MRRRENCYQIPRGLQHCGICEQGWQVAIQGGMEEQNHAGRLGVRMTKLKCGICGKAIPKKERSRPCIKWDENTGEETLICRHCGENLDRKAEAALDRLFGISATVQQNSPISDDVSDFSPSTCEMIPKAGE